MFVFQIKLCFPLVGHTHEDIDQMFSCFTRRLAKQDAHTLVDLSNVMESSYTPRISVKPLKDWMDEVCNDMSGHVFQHQFKIVRNKEGKAEVFYKKWSSSEKRLPEGKSGINVIDGIPTGHPEILPPRIDNRIEENLPKFRLKFNEANEKWWSDFIEAQRKRETETPNLQ